MIIKGRTLIIIKIKKIMKTKISATIALTAALALSLYAPAFALVGGVVTGDEDTNAEVKIHVEAQSSSSVGDKENDERDSSSSVKVDSEERAEAHASSSVSAEAMEHRSAVAAFVQGLLKIADREPGIGSEVRVIAQEQGNSSSTTADAIVKVESRGKLQAFLFGTDYKNTGVIRSELAKTGKRIARLEALASSTSISVQDKTELEVQISTLKAEEVKLNAFIAAHEDTFSLFGWFAKVFVK